MYPYQRGTSSSSTSPYQGPQQQQQPAPPPPAQQSHPRRSPSNSTGSPEQNRSHSMGRIYQQPHEEYRHPSHNYYQRGSSDMHDAREPEEWASRRWMEEQSSYGPSPAPERTSPYAKQQTQPTTTAPPPPPHSSYSSRQTSYSHPASPSQRPRTPPPQHYVSSHRPSSWDPSASGPMSAPPSLVPRANPNGIASGAASSSGAAAPHSGPLSHHTSPILPSLMRGSKNHSRLPSWGPHANSASSGPRSDGASASTGAANNSSGAGGGGGAGGSSNAPQPPPVLPFRGQSVGLGDAFSRSELGSVSQQERRKRPASDSPPNAGMGGTSMEQSSPTQRGDPMSMSSILGPSSRSSDVDKRRRMEGLASMPPSTSYPVKVEGVPTGTSSTAKITATNVNGSPISNLARRKWSGPIAEEAAQHAAAWRAQEQRWGSSRSPKIGLTPLAGASGSGAQTEQSRTPPMGSITSLKRGNSPGISRGGEGGHKRQRSDGFQAMHGSPLGRNLPLRDASPPLAAHQAKAHSQSSGNSPAAYNHPLPPMSRGAGGAGKQFGGQTQSGGFYHPASPPPPVSSQGSNAPHAGGRASHSTKPYTPSNAYGHPSYHAYDSQGRPVEIDVDEVRGGAFAGHGALPPAVQEQRSYRHGVPYSDPRQRAQIAGQQGRPTPPPPTHAPPKAGVPLSGPTHLAAPSAVKNGAPGQNPARSALSGAKDREPKRRSLSPNMPGPAKGLLAPRLERERSKAEAVGAVVRPAVAGKDFNEGPKVDSVAVWETLEEVQRESALSNDDAVAVGADDATRDAAAGTRARHLGNFRYDPRKSPLLPGELLQANVGATVEIRVSGRHLGLGPQKDGKTGATCEWALGWRARDQQQGKAGEELHSSDEYDVLDDDEAMAFWDQDALLNRKLWGTDVYTDDSDVVAMCLHAGWIKGPVLDGVPAWVPPGKAMLVWKQMTRMYAAQGIDGNSGETRRENGESTKAGHASKARLDRLQSTADLSVIVRIAPKLIAYKGSQRAGVKSRSWGNGHDGVSLVIESVTLQEPGYASGERGLRNVKHRIDHLARLRTLATIAMDTKADERFTERVKGGGLIDIVVAARLSIADNGGEDAGQPKGKPFWQVDVNKGQVL